MKVFRAIHKILNFQFLWFFFSVDDKTFFILLLNTYLFIIYVNY